MAKQVFINLAVTDLQRSMDFYTALGFTNNPQFSDENGKCMVWSENIFVMIMKHEKFALFATKPIADTKTNLAGLFSLSVDSIEEVNSILEKAAADPKWQKTFSVTKEALVSSDILGSKYASIADLSYTKVVGGNLVKVMSWYDNEMGYTHTLVDHVIKLGS